MNPHVEEVIEETDKQEAGRCEVCGQPATEMFEDTLICEFCLVQAMIIADLEVDDLIFRMFKDCEDYGLEVEE